MNLAIFACLAVCLAVATANPVLSSDAAIINTVGTQSVLIDVTDTYSTAGGADRVFKVALGVTVQNGELFINGVRLAHGIQVAIQLVARQYEISNSNQIVNAKNVKVTVQAMVQGQIVNGAMTSLTAQMMISELDGNLLTQVTVQEVVIFLNPNGAEKARELRTQQITQSVLTTAAPVVAANPDVTITPTVAPPKTTGDDSDSKTDSSDSDSDTDNESESTAHSDEEKCHVRRFFHWLRNQSFGVRLLVLVIITLFVAVTLKVLLCLVLVCCCGKRQAKCRTTYLNNVKLHYVPLSMDDEKDVKKLQLV